MPNICLLFMLTRQYINWRNILITNKTMTELTFTYKLFVALSEYSNLK